VGIALLESGEFKNHRGLYGESACIRLEAGGGLELGGPDLTDLFFQIEAGRLKSVSFSHSLVEITATGQVWTGADGGK
jgi:cytochrome c2